MSKHTPSSSKRPASLRCAVLLCAVLVCVNIPVNANWAKRARDYLQKFPYAKIIKVIAPTEFMVKCKGKDVHLQLAGIKPIPVDGDAGLQRVKTFISKSKKLDNLVLILKETSSTAGKKAPRTGTLQSRDDGVTLQYLLVSNGLAVPTKDAPAALKQASEDARTAKKGFWELKKKPR